MCGCWAASKKSAPSTMCARNSAGRLIVIDATRARPGAPSSVILQPCLDVLEAGPKGPDAHVAQLAWNDEHWDRRCRCP